MTTSVPMASRHAALRFAFLGIGLVVASSVSVASADATSDADALVDRGVDQRRAGDDRAALASFTAAWELDHSPRARAQMALAEQALGLFVEAETHLLEALADSDDPWIARRRDELAQALEAIRDRLGTLEITGGIDGAEIRLDGRSVGTLPLVAPIRVVSGSYRLEIVARGFYPVTRTVTVVGEATTRESIAMTPRRGAPASEVHEGDAAPSARRSSPTRRTIAFATLGGAGALLVTSGVFFLVREGRASDYNANACLAGGRTRGENCGGIYDDAIRAQRTSAATLALGIASAGAGTLLLVLGGHDDQTPATSLACGADTFSTWGARCRLRF